MQDEDAPFDYSLDSAWDLAGLTRAKERVSERAAFIAETMDSIKSQLDAAGARRLAGGEWSDPEWWARAKAALRYKAREHQLALRTISEINRRIKRVNIQNDQKNEARMFVSAAKRILPEDTYLRIWDEVKRELMALEAIDAKEAKS